MLFSTKSKPPPAKAECRKSDVIPPLRSAALLSAVVPRNFRRVIMCSRSARLDCLLFMLFSGLVVLRFGDGAEVTAENIIHRPSPRAVPSNPLPTGKLDGSDVHD